MRRIIAAFSQTALAIVLVVVGIAVQRDSARAATGWLVYALTSPNPTPDYTFGSAVAAGDVNGDRRADVIVGTPGQNQVDVFSGADGALLYSLLTPNPTPNAGFGAAVAAGDVNGDGKADVIVAAPSETVGANNGQGRVYVFSGADGTLLNTLDTANPAPSDGFGSAVAAGDVNGDGKADIIVAAPTESVPPNGSTGRVYVFSGADASLLYTHVTDPAQFGEFGTAVAAGDLNGDGRADTVVGAWMGAFIGAPLVQSYVYIFSGADGSLVRAIPRPVYARDDKFGSALAIGDVNGDGTADVFVGDPAKGFVYDVSVYIFDGLNGSLLYKLTNPNPVPGAFPSFGTAVAAGDLNGDGKADAIVGTLPDPFAIPNVGRVYVFSGADGSLLDTLDTPNPNISAAAFFGTAVAAGDVTGDGKASVIVGAPDGTYSQDGWAYVIAHEADGDGCADAKELLLIPLTDPLDPWDFFSVPVPALFSAQYPTIVFRDSAVTAVDAQAVFAYFKAGAKAGTSLYEQDLNRNGIKDGVEYDRTVVGPGHSGPPDGAVTARDAQVAFAQYKSGYHC